MARYRLLLVVFFLLLPWSVRAQVVIPPPGGGGPATLPATTCVEQVAVGMTTTGVLVCAPVTAAMTMGLVPAGVDVSASGEVTATHLAAPLPVPQGGTGLATGPPGGLLYFLTTTVVAALPPLAQHAPLVGGSPGEPPTAGTRSGTTLEFATVLGPHTSGKQVTFDVDGNLVATVVDVGAGGGTGGAVASVFGRTGAVFAQPGDYTAAQVTNAASLTAANVFTAPAGQTMAQMILSGALSGTLTLRGASVLGTSLLVLPQGSTDFSGTGGPSQVVRQSTVGGALTVSQLAVSDLTGTGILCTTAVVCSGYQAALAFTPEDVGNKSSGTALGTSSLLYPTQGAVKTYVDTGLATKQDILGFTPENVARKSNLTTLGTSTTDYPTQNAVKVYVDAGLAGKQQTLGFVPEDVANKSSSVALTGTPTNYPTQSAVKTYVDTGLATKQATLTFTPEDVANRSASTTLTGTATNYPTQTAVKTYVDTGLATKQSTITWGVGLLFSGGTVSVASTQAGFLTDGGATSLTCASGQQGKMQVMDTGELQFCDGAPTSLLRSGFLTQSGLTWNVTPGACTGDANAGKLTLNPAGTQIVCASDIGGAGGGGGVTSIFGRTGAILAQTGDYTAAQVTNAADLTSANTFSHATGQTMARLILPGTTSGTLSLRPPAVAGTSVLVWPAGSTDFTTTGGAGQVLRQSTVGGALTVSTLALSDVTGVLTQAQISNLNTLNTGLTALRCVETDATGKLTVTLAPCLPPNAAADGTTKGLVAFVAGDFECTGGVCSLDYASAQAASSTTKGFLTAADWSAFNAKQAPLGFTPENVTNKSDVTTLGTSATAYPTQNAVKAYVDTGLALKQNTVTWGAGLANAGDIGRTASQEAGFLADGAAVDLVCGAANQGKMQVMDDGRVQVCDGATTSGLQQGRFTPPPLTWNVTAATCTADGNLGKLTVNGTNQIVCAADAAGAAGDVASVGNCSSGACLDGSVTGGTTLALYDGDSHAGTLQSVNLTAARTYSLPNESGTLCTSGSVCPGYQASLGFTPVPPTQTLEVVGTSNQITVSPTGAQTLAANRTWTLSLPQSIDLAALVRFGSLGLGVATPTTPGLLAQTAAANTVSLQTLKRFTDTAPAGAFATYQSAAGASLWTVDIGGTLTAGTVAVPVRDKGGAVYNVVAYGADPTGTTDSTAAFTALMGRHLYVPEGTFLVGRLIPTSGTVIECASWKSILKLPNNSSPLANDIWIGNHYAAAPADQVIIRNCQFDGNKGSAVGNTNGSTLSLTGVNTLVENNYIHDSAYACVVYGKPTGSGKAWIRNNWCHNPSMSNLGWGGFGIVGGDGVNVENNYCTTSDSQSAYCVDLEPNDGWTATNVVVRGNVGLPGGVWLRPAPTGVLSNVIATGNYASAVGAFGGNPACYLLRLTGYNVVSDNTCIAPTATHAAMQVNTVVNTVITGNKLIFGGQSQQLGADTLSGAVLFANTISGVHFSGNSMLATGRSVVAGTPFCINEFSNGTTIDVEFGHNEATGCQPYRSQPAIQGIVHHAVPALVRNTKLTTPPLPLGPMTAVGDMRNVLPWSDVFQGHWTIGAGLAVTDLSVPDPHGTLGAAHFLADATGTPHTASLTVPQGTVSGDWWNVSLWLKATTGTASVTVTLAGNVTPTLATQLFTATTTWRRVEIAGQAIGTDTSLTVTLAGAASADFAVWRVVLAPGQQAAAPVGTAGAAVLLPHTFAHAGPVDIGGGALVRGANAQTLVTLKRATDATPTGAFADYQSAAGASLWQVDIAGTLAAGTIPVARLAGDLPYANLTPATAPGRLLGRGSATAGDWQEVTLGANLSMSGTTLHATGGGGGVTDGDKDDITVSASGTVWTIDPGAVTYAKLQPTTAPAVVLGRGAAGAGALQEVTLGTNLSMTGTTLNASMATVADIGTATSLATSFYVGDATAGHCTWSEDGVVYEAACDVDKTTLFTSDIMMFDSGPLHLRNADGDICATTGNLTGLTTYHGTNACQRPSLSRPFDAMAFNVGPGVTIETVALNGWPGVPVLDGPNTDAGLFSLVIPVLWRDFAEAGQMTLQLTCHSMTNQNALTLSVRVGAAVCTGANESVPAFVAPTTGALLTCTFGPQAHDVQMSNMVTLNTTGCAAGEQMRIPFVSEADSTAGWSTSLSFITGGLLTYETVGTP